MYCVRSLGDNLMTEKPSIFHRIFLIVADIYGLYVSPFIDYMAVYRRKIFLQQYFCEYNAEYFLWYSHNIADCILAT